MEFLSNFSRIKSLQGMKKTLVKNKFNKENLLYRPVRLLHFDTNFAKRDSVSYLALLKILEFSLNFALGLPADIVLLIAKPFL